jgi:hypothetical protein
MFRYICIILSEFQICTSLKLRILYIITISLQNCQIKIFRCLLIKCSLYDFYNIICFCSTFTWPYMHLDIPVLMLPLCWGGECWTVVGVRLGWWVLNCGGCQTGVVSTELWWLSDWGGEYWTVVGVRLGWWVLNCGGCQTGVVSTELWWVSDWVGECWTVVGVRLGWWVLNCGGCQTGVASTELWWESDWGGECWTVVGVRLGWWVLNCGGCQTGVASTELWWVSDCMTLRQQQTHKYFNFIVL